MIKVYFNYPNSRITVHGDPRCTHIQSHEKPGQRSITIDLESFSTEIRKFETGSDGYRFASHRGENDMWVTINFGDPAFEAAVSQFLHKLLGKRYKRFRAARMNRCC
jgi:hypothetical protein